jgi:hypothetical protein
MHGRFGFTPAVDLQYSVRTLGFDNDRGGASLAAKEEPMLVFHRYHANLEAFKPEIFAELVGSLSPKYQAIFEPSLKFEAELLKVDYRKLMRPKPFMSRSASYTDTFVYDGEVFTDGEHLYMLTVEAPLGLARRVRFEPGTAPAKEEETELWLYTLSPNLDTGPLDEFIKHINEAFNVQLTPRPSRSGRFEELKNEGRESPQPPSDRDIAAIELLSDKATRTVATQIKAVGGLLVTDIAKQLPPESRGRAQDIQRALRHAGLVESEVVVVCSKTNTQATRVPSRDLLDEAAQRGFKCACGKSIVDEPSEEALAITEYGRTLLDGSRWFSLLVVKEIASLGIDIGRILIEQQIGGDEVDCLCDIGGELVFFELKDKEFNLGNAYSCAAKIGILKPGLSVIITTAHVGNDAREHFQRAELAEGRARRYMATRFGTDQGAIRYIEGLETLRNGLEHIITQIYSRDAAQILSFVWPVVEIDPVGLVQAIEERGASSSDKESRRSNRDGRASTKAKRRSNEPTELN